MNSHWICLFINSEEKFQADWLKHIWLLIIIIEILTNSVSFTNNWIEAIMMWHLISFNVRGIISESSERLLLCLLLISTLLGYQNLFSTSLPTTSFTKLQPQHILMNVKNVVNQITSVKIAQSLKSTTQFRLKKLSFSLIISSSVKILKHNISAAMITMISQKII